MTHAPDMGTAAGCWGQEPGWEGVGQWREPECRRAANAELSITAY